MINDHQNKGSGDVSDQEKKEFRFSTLGIIIGVLLVVVSVVWVTMSIISGKETSGEDVTWVG